MSEAAESGRGDQEAACEQREAFERIQVNVSSARREQQQEGEEQERIQESAESLESSDYAATDDESGGHRSSDYSQCRSANFGSTRSWLQSPEHDLGLSRADFYGFRLDSGGSGDAFVDALDEYLESDRDETDLGISEYIGDPLNAVADVREVQGTGRPDACEHSKSEHFSENATSELFGEQDLRTSNEEQQQFIITGGLVHEDVRSHEALEAERTDSVRKLVEVSSNPGEEKTGGVWELSESFEVEGTGIVQGLDKALEVEETDIARDLDGAFQCPPEVQTSMNHFADEHAVPDDSASEQGSSPVDGNPDAFAEQSAQHPVSTKKKCVMRLGSTEAERLLQMDVEDLVKPIRLENGGIRPANEELGPDEVSRYLEVLEVKETYMTTVWDMEDILLDTENTGTRLSKKVSNQTASSSVYDGLWKVDSVEVIGARQRRGGASLGERVRGVREHTIYKIRVISGRHEWEIERRYREFVELFQQLKKMFSSQSRTVLPSPWEQVTAESRKVFGNTSPDVVEVRSALVQVCLQSAVQAGVPISTAAPLLRFLFPNASECRTTDAQSGAMPLRDFSSESSAGQEDDRDNGLPFGRTIRLLVQIPPKKPLRQQVLNQRNLCAGCFEQLTTSVNIVSDIVKGLGWGKPRLCEYTGKLFCSSCHLNETAILPAAVLREWDFTPRSVSQLAKAYLDSIYDQPMLCVSAVNPLLYAKVPILAHVKEMRTRLSKIASNIRCMSRSRIHQALGPRRYFLENNDFYAMRDLADLSKGAFSVLTGLLKSTEAKLVTHVRHTCSVCTELGEPCRAGVFCNRPVELIYPYEVDESAQQCQRCSTYYHKVCLRTIRTCWVCNKESPRYAEEQEIVSSSDRRPSVTPSVASSDSLQTPKPKRMLLASLFGVGSRETRARARDRGSSTILSMSTMLGSLEM